MSEYNYNYHDDNFSLDEADSYTLLIQIDKTSFSYAITHQDKLIACADMHPLDELSNPQELLDLLSAKYKQVVVGLPANGFTLVPQHLFSQEHIASFARFLDVKANEKVSAQQLDAENTILYKTSNDIITVAEEFGLRHTVFNLKGWVAALAQNNPGNADLYLDINGSQVTFAAFNNGRLRFLNKFDFKNTDELAYFTAMVLKELHIEPADARIHLSGEVDTDDQSISRLAEFFGSVQLNQLQIVSLPREIESHKILSLAALSLCASLEVV
ncbi:DUF3822 family protein [Mucilaginibacter aquaedulcis]|uniref:DUF3822 family protein n=1 Tax=Mucilaginibacter aquaedulcis TaxID=1187081 RepID=UPI0025B3FD94|nr:DUF3822 family protein [Mucilaginibacter aquaedulcis]MDN3546900.1 DUF3822 family protein [Mucilaginibacter aquaedulcis]